MEIQDTLEKYKALGATKGPQWAINGNADVTKLRLSLEAHKSALEIALEMVQVYAQREMAKSSKADPMVDQSRKK